MNCSDFFEGAEVVLNDRGAASKIFDDNGGLKKMNVNGIEATGYPTWKRAKKAQQNTSGKSFAEQVYNVVISVFSTFSD